MEIKVFNSRNGAYLTHTGKVLTEMGFLPRQGDTIFINELDDYHHNFTMVNYVSFDTNNKWISITI